MPGESTKYYIRGTLYHTHFVCLYLSPDGGVWRGVGWGVSVGMYVKKMQAKSTSEKSWANFVHQYKEVPNKKYDSQWRKIDGDSTIRRAMATISRSVNRGASDVLQPKCDTARSETDNLPY